MDPSDPVRSASYIEEITSQLVPIAQRSGMEFLAYLLEMARIEAHAQANASVLENDD
ncbi:MAG: hypothetical protein R3D43_10055 [Tepidamorphaceae bacterium]|nr:hypothetical protein [Nitratireductor sp.]MCC0048773.1 hypothetical protein [Rhodobiaceae bacterium]